MIPDLTGFRVLEAVPWNSTYAYRVFPSKSPILAKKVIQDTLPPSPAMTRESSDIFCILKGLIGERSNKASEVLGLTGQRTIMPLLGWVGPRPAKVVQLGPEENVGWHQQCRSRGLFFFFKWVITRNIITEAVLYHRIHTYTRVKAFLQPFSFHRLVFSVNLALILRVNPQVKLLYNL